eukprot:maker-scaffold_33-snap-gene-1.52-mRNA-1 protein AED:0.18 eAED:0.18 QI:0/0/0/0.5/1/1/2/0/537
MKRLSENASNDFFDLEHYEESWELGYGENTTSDFNDLNKEKIKEENEIKSIIISQLQSRHNKGQLTRNQLEELKNLYFKYIGAFGIRQSIAQMSKIPPMPVVLKPDAKPFRAPAREMNAVKKEAMRKKIQDLIDMGMLALEPDPLYSSPAFMVPKKNNKWRMVIDLRDLNKVVQVIGTSLVDLEAQLNWLPSEINHMASFDALSGFDMMPISEEAAKYFNISTPFGCYRLLGSPMGFINTPFIYSTRMISFILGGHQGVFGTPNQGCLQWLDDSLIYSNEFQQFKQVIETILSNCIKYKLRLNAMKCEFYTTETEWCGRTITRKGRNFSQKHFDKILSMECPKTLGQLEDILYVSSWLALALPKLSTIKSELQSLALELKRKLFLDKGKRIPKKFRSKMNIEGSVEYNTLKNNFNMFKKVLAAAAKNTLKHIDPEQQLEIYTDASDNYWVAVITIVTHKNEDNIIEQQKVENLNKVESPSEENVGQLIMDDYYYSEINPGDGKVNSIFNRVMKLSTQEPLLAESYEKEKKIAINHIQ